MRFEDLKSSVTSLELINKGWRGLVYRATLDGQDLAIKVARGQDKEYAIRKEGNILQRLRGLKGFPQLVRAGEDFVAYRFIEGIPVEKMNLTFREKTKVYLRVLELIRILDSLHINKDELGCLKKNTLITQELDVYLLDFERGNLQIKKRHNLSQFLQLLVKEGVVQMDRAVELGRRYSEGEEVYDEVESLILSAV